MFELKACKESIIPEVVKVISYRQVNLCEFWPQSKYAKRYHVQTSLCNTSKNRLEGLTLANIYQFKVNKRNTRKRFEVCLKLTIKTPARWHWCCFGAFIVNFEHISHLFIMFLLLTLNK